MRLKKISINDTRINRRKFKIRLIILPFNAERKEMLQFMLQLLYLHATYGSYKNLSRG